jgi:hypothetical protein
MKERKEERERVTLEWRDFVALFVAALQTVALPFIILLILLLVLVIVFGLLS